MFRIFLSALSVVLVTQVFVVQTDVPCLGFGQLCAEPRSKDREEPERELWVIASSLNIRSEPTTKSKVIGKVKYGEKVILAEPPEGKPSPEGWAYARVSQTRLEGWMSAKYLSIDKPEKGYFAAGKWLTINTPADTVVKYMKQRLGRIADVEQLGSDDEGLIVAWKFSDVTFILKRRTVAGITCYRVTDVRR